MHVAYWAQKAKNTHSEYVIFIAFTLQQWLHERASILRHTTLPVLLWDIYRDDISTEHDVAWKTWIS